MSGFEYTYESVPDQNMEPPEDVEPEEVEPEEDGPDPDDERDRAWDAQFDD